MAAHELHETAKALVADNKGILAADESSGTIEKRFDTISLESTEENRRAYRDMLFTTPDLEEYVSGVIFYDETLRQSASDGTPFAKLLADKGIIPGIKVDTGAKDLAFAPGEKVTEGLDGLRERLQEYRELGARFAKWRAVITIGEGIPTANCIGVNAHALGAVRGALSGAGDRADRRARGADGRGQRHRDVLPGHEADAAQGLRRALPPARRPRGDAAEAEHGHLGQGQLNPGERRRGRRLDAQVLPRDRAGGGARDRLPLRRPVRRAGEREPERHQLASDRSRGCSPSRTDARCRRRR